MGTKFTALQLLETRRDELADEKAEIKREIECLKARLVELEEEMEDFQNTIYCLTL